MRRSLAVASTLLAVATIATAQESVLLRVGGSPGSSNRYQSVMDMFVLGGPMTQMGGDTSQPFMRVTVNQTRALSTVTGDTLTFTETVDSARSESPAMPQMGAMMGGAANAMRGRVTTTKMDNRARIFGIEITNANAPGAGAGGSGGPGGPGGGRGRGGPMGGMGGSQRVLYMLPERAVRVGETWTDSSSTPAAGTEGATNFLATFKLERVDSRGSARVAVISLDGNMATTTPQGPTRYSVTGQFQMDLTNHRLASFNMIMSGTSQMQGQEVPVRIVLTQNLVN